MDENDEILDLVNYNDEVVGTIKRGEMAKLGYRHTEGYVRFAVGFLFNTKGQVWVPVRGKHKVIAPGGLDFSAAEHVLSGETYERAIIRAFSEETGLKVNREQLKFVGRLHPSDEKPSYEGVFVYENYTGLDPIISHEEFDGAQWIDLPGFERKLKDTSIPSKSAILPALLLIKSLSNPTGLTPL